MELTLTITTSPKLPASALEAFAEKARRMNKEPSDYLAEIIEREANKPAPQKKGARK